MHNTLTLFRFSVVTVIILSVASWAISAEIRVPDDYSTIQEAIDNSSYGDTVLVAAGTYNERIVVKAGITVDGAGRDVTFIDGGGRGAIVWISDSARAYNTTFRGFTVQNGYDGVYRTDEGADSGIYIDWPGSATIEDNTINSLGNYGIWVPSSYADTVIRNNTIFGNLRYGIANYNGDPIIEKNLIYGNNWGGIESWNSYSEPDIRNNTIVDNVGEGWAKGVVFGNGSRPHIFENNIIAYNGGDGVFIYSNNNLILPLRLYFNTVYGNGTPHNENVILDPATSIQDSPLFVDRPNHTYTLSPNSPCINAGNPGTQFNDTDNTRNDMGAYGGTGIYSGDLNPPQVATHTPQNDSRDITNTPTIEITITDSVSGIDLNNLTIDINSSRVFDGSDQATYPDATVSGNQAQYVISYTPPTPFQSGEKVFVYCNCRDLRSNLMPQYGFSFLIEPYAPRTIVIPSDFATIQQGVDAARYGDTVRVGVGLFDENIELKEGIVLQGTGPYFSTIRGQGGNSVIKAAEYSTIENLSIHSGYNQSTIYCWEASPVVRNNLIISSSSTNSNYGIFASTKSTPTITNNTIIGYYNGVLAGSNAAVLKNNIITSCRSKGVSGTAVQLEYNNIFDNSTNYDGCSAGTGDISVDPGFTDGSSDKYTLGSNSSCIDSGNPGTEFNDRDNSPNDMGAFGGPHLVCEKNKAVVALAASIGENGCSDCQGDMDGDQDIDAADLTRLVDLLGFIDCSF